MKKGELKERVYDALGKILSDHGFKVDKKTDGFNKKTSFGFERIGFGIVDYAPEQRIGFAASVRHKKIEDICNQYLNIPTQSAPNSITLIKNIDGPGEKQSGRHRYYKIISNEDMDEMFMEIIPEIKTTGFDFFKKYSSLEEINKKLNDTDRFVNPHINNHFAFRALTLAKLCGRQDFEELISFYRKKFELHPNKFLYPDNFNALIEYLRNYSEKD